MMWLIDRSGVSWPTNAHPIAQWDAECDPVGYVVADLGFIHLRLLNGGATVSFNPSRVGQATMIAAFYLIAGEQPKRIALSYAGKCPDHQIFGTLGDAFRRIEELSEAHPSPIPTISERRRSLDRPPKYVAEPIRELLRAWSNMAGQWTPERHANFCTAVDLKDTVVVRSAHRTDRLVNFHWGANFDFLGPRWAQIALGKDVEDQPFPELGKRIASMYRRMLANREPKLDEIELAHSIAGFTTFRRRYARLLLPWSEPGGDRYVMLLRFDKNPPPYEDHTLDSVRDRRMLRSRSGVP